MSEIARNAKILQKTNKPRSAENHVREDGTDPLNTHHIPTHDSK